MFGVLGETIREGIESGWYATVVFRLMLSVVLTGLPGTNRRRTAHPAGMRTHMIIGMGACLLMLVSIGMAEMVPGYQGDPARIAAQVVTGIGFLGAGAIIRLGFSVKGLTTAASVWMCAGVGLAVGAGNYFEACVAAGLLYFVLTAVERFEVRLFSKHQLCRLHVAATGGTDTLNSILKALESHESSPDSISTSRDIKNNKVSVILYLPVRPEGTLCDLESDLAAIEGIETISWNRE